MKIPAIVLYIICLTCSACAQDEDYKQTDRIAMDIPSSQTNSTTDIASYIKDHFKNDNEKVRAIYIWVITHIKYSADSIHRVILNEDRDQLVTYALRRKKGVCENFAAIFDDICRKSGLASFAVEGYTRQNSSVDKTSHVWNIVFVNNKWFLFDPTWDAGEGFQTATINSFKVSPEVFIQSHMPFDPIFQLLNYPLTFKEFNSGFVKQKTNAIYFNYTDSLNEYEKASPLNRYLGALLRIENNGVPNNMINTRLSQLRLEIELIYQVKDSVLYNDAIADYNYATNNFNNFIAYRNNEFKPAKTDAEIQSIFDEVKKRITSARIKLKEVNQSKATLALNTGDVEYALTTLFNHVKEQEVYLKNYKLTVKDK